MDAPGRSLLLLITLAVTFVSAPSAQERKVPDDSARVSIPGCARNRVFIVGESAEHEPTTARVPPGRRFRLNGKKKLLDEIKNHSAQMVEVTGLVRLADLGSQGGISLGGGKVRIGGGQPRDPMGGMVGNPGIDQAMIDVESWRPLPESCPAK
jgi:hypothetical protein